jgi:hypothetical protein
MKLYYKGTIIYEYIHALSLYTNRYTQESKFATLAFGSSFHQDVGFLASNGLCPRPEGPPICKPSASQECRFGIRRAGVDCGR